MQFNWKILAALIVLVSGFLWGVQSLRTRSYNASDVNFAIGSGSVRITNSSSDSVPVQLIGTGTRAFSITSSSDELSGTSIRQDSGSQATQLLEFDLPIGASEFSIVDGVEVRFVATAIEPLEVSLQPLNAKESQVTLLATVIIMMGAILAIFYMTRQYWISRLRRPDFQDQDTQPMAATSTSI